MAYAILHVRSSWKYKGKWAQNTEKEPAKHCYKKKYQKNYFELENIYFSQPNILKSEFRTVFERIFAYFLTEKSIK